MSEFQAKLKAILDTSDVDKSIKGIESTKITLSNIAISSQAKSSLKTAIQDALKDIKVDLNINANGKSGGTGFNKVTKEAQKLQSVMDKINSYSLDASIAKVTQKYSQYAGSGHAKLSEIETDLKEIQSLQNKLNSGSTTNMVQDYEKLQSTLKKVQNNLTIVSSEGSKAVSALQKTNLDNSMQAWCNNNTKAVKVYGSAIEELRKELQNVTDVKGLNDISNQFKAIQLEAKATGNVGKSLADEFKSAAVSLAGFITAGAGIDTIVSAMQDGVSTVIDLDTALVDLQKTTTATASELNQFYEDANNVAKQYGASTQEIIQTAADWSRLGYNIDDSKLMSQYASMFKSISPGMDIDSSTNGLVSIMKAFGIEASDALDGVMSKINIVGNSFATSNVDIVEGLKRSSAAMAAGNNTLEETVGLFTSAEEIINDPSSVGNALKTISMRLRGYDEETETLSDDLQTITGDIADLTKTASNNYSGVSLFTDETRETYKSTAQILSDISDIWDELTDKTQAQLLEKMFGKNRASVGAALIEQMKNGTYDRVIESMTDSTGNAEKEMEIITQSIEYKLNALKETGTGIWQNLFGREEIGAVIDLLTQLAEVIQFVTKNIGLFRTAGVATGIAALVKNLG